MTSKQARRTSRLHSSDPADSRWRAGQAHVHADIEGLSRDPEADRMVAAMDQDGVPIEQQVERLKTYFRRGNGRAIDAA